MNKKTYLNGMRPLVIAAALAAAGNLVHAEDATEGQILRALTPAQPLTRSLSMTPPADSTPSAESRFVDSLRNRPTRSLSLGERQQITTIAKDKPKIDLEINFDYNSTNISAKSLPSRAARWAGSRGICTSTGAEGTTISPPSWVSCSKPGMSPV